ncbi:MAG: hypothetical protein JW765_03230 [Deltaproteobacteria bacterium]|nr:hypothetical protein [Candidatus Zymogenaceae bacterium]
MFEKGLVKLGIPAKLLITVFLCVMGLGYIFAIFTIYISHENADAKPGLSMNDIVITYYGNREGTAMEDKSLGSMATYFSSDGDKNAVIEWIRAGAEVASYDETVAPILKKSCTMCHSKDGTESGSPLTAYDEVMKYVTVSTGVSPGRLGTLSHTHLISHGVMFFLLSLVFIATTVGDRWKILLVLMAYAGIVIDVFSWWLAKTAAAFAYFSVIGGALLGIAFLFFFFVPLWEMWVKKK